MTNTANNRKRRVAIITDTAQHLGPYLARELAQRDHDLVISDPNVVIEDVESSAPDLVNELSSMGVQVEVVDVDDVNQAGSVQKLVDRAQEAFGGFDSAFVRPGVHILADFQSATVEKFQGSVEGNMLSVMYALQALLPPLMAQGSGQVLIEVSATGSKDWPGTGFLYGATRAGAKYMVNNAALEAAKCGVSVNGMGTMFLDYPGFVKSTNAYDPKVAAEIKKMIPEGRYGKPEEAAHLAASLLDGKCNYNVATKEVTPLITRVPNTEEVSVQTVYGPTEKRFKLSELDDTNSRPIALANDASISADGKRIYFSESYVVDGATMGGIKSLYQMVMLGTTGRLWMLDTENQTVSLIANGFTFTDGVLVEENQNGPEASVLLADNAKFQIHRIHLSGSKVGQDDIIWQDLPGLVDGFHRDAEERIWVSIIQTRTPQLVYIHANPEVKPMIMKHPPLIAPLDSTAILVLSSDASKPLWYTEHPQTKVTSIPSAITGKDGVYLTNFSAKTPGLHRMDNPFTQ